MDTVSVGREIAAPAAAVMRLITDITRYGEWSPETTSCVWSSGVEGPSVGATFRGSNRNGLHRWTTTCRVTACDARHFGFHVTYLRQQVADWDYRITETPGGCLVTETFTDRRSPLFARFGTLGTGVSDRHAHNRNGMQATLEALAAEAEIARI